MGRGLLVARAAWPGVGDVLFGVAHLESFVGARSTPRRRRRAAGAAWRDAWRDRGSPKASEFTYDGRANGMLKHGFKHRFDRVFVLDREVGTRTIQHEKKGTLPMFPDHFGVEVTLEKRAAAALAPAAAKRPAAANAFFQPRKKAAPAAAAATGRYRGAKIPAGWDLRHGCLLVRRWGDAPPHTERLLGFDFDDTLVPLNYARPEPSQWSHLYGHAPGHLRSLDATTGLAVLSNECLDRLKKVEVLENKLRQKCGRLDNWARDVAAKGAGMWDFALDELGVADKAACNAQAARRRLGRGREPRASPACATTTSDYFGAMFPPVSFDS
ncbi:5'-tyrosyl-DNA phosphodiesterase [Aureococcus anophagefferens]|nr:5'-tyrosyl-DNA phosphodiesterase [Aureococcus anophagefferens]